MELNKKNECILNGRIKIKVTGDISPRNFREVMGPPTEITGVLGPPCKYRPNRHVLRDFFWGESPSTHRFFSVSYL